MAEEEKTIGKIVLKPVEDNDLDLINRWINKEHVLKWYHDADDWMNELRNRHGEFLFIRHYIAFEDGVPFGFCQYYDCLDAKTSSIFSCTFRFYVS